MDGEIYLIELFKVLWKKKIFIISGMVVFSVLTLIFFLLQPLQYQSSGFLAIASDSYKMSLPDYKEASSVFFDKKLFEHYFFSEVKGPKKEWKTFLKQLLLSKYVKPVYAYTKEDQEKIGGLKDMENYIMGIQISMKNKDRNLVKTFVTVIGKFIRDSIFYQKLRGFIISEFDNTEINLKTLNKEELSSLFAISLLNEKKSMLNHILQKYKNSQKIYEKQIIPIEKNSYQYLSPIVQLIGIESQITDLKIKLLKIKREKKKAELIIEFLGKFIEHMNNVKRGDQLLKLWNKEFKKFFSNKNKEDSWVREVEWSLKASVLDIQDKFYKKIGFFAGGVSVKSQKLPVKKIIILVLFFSFLLFSFVALLIEGNKKEK